MGLLINKRCRIFRIEVIQNGYRKTEDRTSLSISLNTMTSSSYFIHLNRWRPSYYIRDFFPLGKAPEIPTDLDACVTRRKFRMRHVATISTTCSKSQKNQTFKIVISLFSTRTSCPVTWIRIQNQFPFHRKKFFKISDMLNLFWKGRLPRYLLMTSSDTKRA